MKDAEYYKKKVKHLEKIRCQSVLYSKQSQELFWKIFEQLNDDDRRHCYFAELNQEFAKSGSGCQNKFQYAYDFVLTNRHKIIEFNGDYWHMNSKLYKAEDVNEVTRQTAHQTWQKDKEKLKFIEQFSFDVLVVWDSEWQKDQDNVIKKCLTFLQGE